MYTKLENIGYGVTTGTSYKGGIIDTTYQDLVDAFGEPTFPEPSGDDKVQKEWVFKDSQGNIFTIYDWKTYDVHTTMTRLEVWHIGGKRFAGDFIDWVESQVHSKLNISI